MRRAKPDIWPALTPLIVAAIAAPFFGSFSTFATLTLASLAMGAMLFVMASGLTLAFGLMDVLNFGHGAFIAVGAFVATVVYAAAPQGSLALDLAVFALALAAAALVCGALGFVYERLLIAPVYGRHLEQILITIGGVHRHRAIAAGAVRNRADRPEPAGGVARFAGVRAGRGREISAGRVRARPAAVRRAMAGALAHRASAC